MKTGLLLLFLAAFVASPLTAHAQRRYFLVGLRHVYEMSTFPDPYQNDRQKIEEDYADAVDQSQTQYDRDMGSIATQEASDNGNFHQGDRDAVESNTEVAVADAADQRDKQLGQYYALRDGGRKFHPELKVDQDGPYQVMGIDQLPDRTLTNVIFYEPYPMYGGVCPFGWQYGTVYTWDNYVIAARNWHHRWITLGGPLFWNLSLRGHLVEVYAPIRRFVVYDRTRWVDGRPPVFTPQSRLNFERARAVQVRQGVFHEHAYGTARRAPVAPVPPVRGIAPGRPRPGAPVRHPVAPVRRRMPVHPVRRNRVPPHAPPVRMSPPHERGRKKGG